MDDEIERCPATSAVTLLRDIELNRAPPWLPKLFFLLWTRSENRTTLEVRTQTSAPFFTAAPLGLAPVRSTRATAAQTPKKHERLSI
jgi:hypothetical protein